MLDKVFFVGLTIRLTILSFILSLSIVLSTAFAADTKDSDGETTGTTEKIVITGSRNERVLSNAPVKTELVEKEVIERNHLTDLSQVLDNILGITLQGLTGRMGRSAVVQGLGDDHVLVMIDGIPQLQTSASGYDLTQLSVNDISSVEVIKGGASSLYGSQAIGGVINIITKKPVNKTQYFLDVKNTVTPTEQTERTESLANMMNATLSGNAADLFNYKLSYGYRNQDPIDLDTTTIAEDLGRTRRQNASAYLSRKVFDKSELFLDYRFIDESLESKLSQASNAGYLPFAMNSFTQTQSATLGLKSRLSDVSNLKLHAHYSKADDLIVYDDLSTTDFIESQKAAALNTVMFESQLDASLIADQISTLGFLYRYQFLDQVNYDGSSSGSSQNTEVDRKSIYSLETYAQHSITKNNFEITPGVRGQYDSSFGGNISPSINSIYSPQIWKNRKTNFRTSIGTGYKVPTLKERFFMMDHRSIANYIIIGSENLNPERSVSFQAGFELIKSEEYSFHINGFVNNVRDMIGIVTSEDSSGVMIFDYKNIGEVISRGVEVSTMINLVKNLNLEQDVTFSRTEDMKTNNIVPLRPQTTYKARLRYKANKDVDLIGLFRYQSDEYVDQDNIEISPAYSVLDLNVNYQYSKQLSLYAGVNNVFDQTRRPAADGALLTMDMRPAIGRQYFMGLNFREL